jgi:hypothetical protein
MIDSHLNSLFSWFLFQQTVATKVPTWYEQASGILAIPITIIGAAYSYVLIKKTRLEVRKTELEIREKEKQLYPIGGDAIPTISQSQPSKYSRSERFWLGA